MKRVIPIGDNNDMLRQKMPEFNFADPIMDATDLNKTLINTMKDEKGVGLAANQLGIATRAFAIHTEPPEVLFNPIITFASDEEVLMDEGCLSYPGVYVKIKRPKDIRVRYKNLHGAICTKRYSGLAARCVQHEIDHLDGIEYFKRAHPIHQERFKKKWTKMTRLLKKAAKLAK